MAKEEGQENKKTAQEVVAERIDLRSELMRFEEAINDLRVVYEQYFMGIIPFEPEKEHKKLKRFLRKLQKAPFKNSQLAYKLRMLETRYQTYHTYWQRVLREREEGKYFKDLFKADLREKIAKDNAEAQTTRGKASKQMSDLFNAYQTALEKQTGKKVKIDFDKFRQSLLKQAQQFKQQNGAKKLAFKVVVRKGKVTVKAHAKAGT